MSNSIKIIQITPGVIPIPPNGWGAVEKIIWEYKLVLDRLGYQTEIKYCDDVQKSDNQVVHVHMANLANILSQRGIDYVFSLHDHHVEYFGKDSECYKENFNAIKNSKLTFVHSKHLIEYFDNLPQIVYLPHGANQFDYQFSPRKKSLKPKLLMMANNGVGGDSLSDRKGFLIGIEAAKYLDLPITIICPSNNKVFFDHHKPDYKNLTIIYDLDYKDSVSKLYEFDIFLHPSNLEAGHPNLTITESISTGMPVVGTINTNISGMISVERNVESFVDGIKKCIKKYDSLTAEIEHNRYLFSWEIIVSKMIESYKTFLKISEKQQLLHNYHNVKITNKPKDVKSSSVVSFSGGKAFCKTSFFSDGAFILFKDRRTGDIIFDCKVGKEPGQWAYAYANDKSFVDWLVEVKQGTQIIYSESLDLSNKKVLLKVDDLFFGIESMILEFIKKTNCQITIKSKFNLPVDGICFDNEADDEFFYFSLNQNQLSDFFVEKNRKPEKYLNVLQSNSLGDTIGFIPYCQKWAEEKGIIVDLSIKRSELFNPEDYKNINFVTESEIKSDYTDINRFEYIFDKPLQKGYSDQFGLTYEEIRAKIKNVKKERPIKSKYVCLGVHTTSQCKYWNYPDGWETISKKLRSIDITPVAVDLYEVFGIEGCWNELPHSAVKKVGLQFDDVINYLQHCEFFIGVSSGLSWLAWALGKKVIMISGTTTEDNEFTSNCTRIINKKVCHGCFNKSSVYPFNAGDWLCCPINRDTSKWFECTKTISPEDVWNETVKLIKTEDEYTI